MKKKFLLSNFIILLYIFSYAQNCGINPLSKSITIKGDTISGLFSKAVINNNFLSQVRASQWATREILSLAWTNNSLGYPTWNLRTLFKYDLTSIPKNSFIQSASLYLYAQPNADNGNHIDPTFGSNNTSWIQRVTGIWNPLTVGWGSQPNVSTTDKVVLNQSTTTRQNYIVDLRDFVQKWVDAPDSNYGVMLSMANETPYNSMIFYSWNAPDSLKPRLEICYSTTLPVSLITFEAYKKEGKAIFKAVFSEEEQLKLIQLEKSNDGLIFLPASMIDKKQLSSFSYETPNESSRYFRLKWTDIYGKSNFSNIINLTSALSNNRFSLYPNPVSENSVIDIKALSNQKVTFFVYDITGKIVIRKVAFLTEGMNKLSFTELSKLINGKYLIKSVIDNIPAFIEFTKF